MPREPGYSIGLYWVSAGLLGWPCPAVIAGVTPMAPASAGRSRRAPVCSRGVAGTGGGAGTPTGPRWCPRTLLFMLECGIS